MKEQNNQSVTSRVIQKEDKMNKLFESLIGKSETPLSVQEFSKSILIELEKLPQIKKIEYFDSAQRFYADIYIKDKVLRLALFESLITERRNC